MGLPSFHPLTSLFYNRSPHILSCQFIAQTYTDVIQFGGGLLEINALNGDLDTQRLT